MTNTSRKIERLNSQAMNAVRIRNRPMTQAERAALHAKCRADYPEEAAREDAGLLFSYALAAADRKMAHRRARRTR